MNILFHSNDEMNHNSPYVTTWPFLLFNRLEERVTKLFNLSWTCILMDSEVIEFSVESVVGWSDMNGYDDVRPDNDLGKLFACTGNCKGSQGK